jgi:hypothetical protein
MDIVKFFETLATHSHHKIHLNSLMEKLSVDIKNAYLMNDTDALKSLLSDIDYLANESHVVKIQ